MKSRKLTKSFHKTIIMEGLWLPKIITYINQRYTNTAVNDQEAKYKIKNHLQLRFVSINQ